LMSSGGVSDGEGRVTGCSRISSITVASPRTGDPPSLGGPLRDSGSVASERPREEREWGYLKIPE
jgi:hypothetical protein